MKFAKNYESKNKHYFPSDKISQELKNDKKYYLSFATTIMAKYVNNQCIVPYSNTNEIRNAETLRAYANGTNSVDKYKDILIGKTDHGSRPKSSINISWDTIRILPQKLDVVRGYFLKLKFDTVTSAIDYQSVASKQAIVSTLKLASNDVYRMMKAEINEIMGSPLAEDPVMPEGAMNMDSLKFESEREVDLFVSMGGVFLEHEAAIANLLDKSKQESDWDGNYVQYINDAVTLGVTVSRVVTNKKGTIVKNEYVDPAMFIGPNNKKPTWGAEIKSITIGELRENTDISEAELVKIASNYSKNGYGYAPSNFYKEAQSFLNNIDYNQNAIEQIKVDYIDCRWVGTYEESFTTVNKKNANNLIFNKVNSNYEVSERDKSFGKTKKKYCRQVIYKCKMIVGTEHVFDCGIDEFLSYDKDINGGLTAVFPYRVQFYESLVNRCIPFADEANMSLYKYRIAKKKMPAPPNLMIKKSSLENVNINGVDFSPEQLIKLYEDEGFLIVDDQNPWGNQNVSTSRAIDIVPTDVIRQLSEWRADIEYNKMMIEQVTGVNDIFSAQSPTAETGLGVTRIAIEATGNALYSIVYGLMEFDSNISRCQVRKWQVVARHISKEERKRLSVGRSLEYIKIANNLDEYDFDPKISVAPQEDEKLSLLQDIARLRDFRRQTSRGGITSSDYVFIWGMIMSGKIKQAQIVLAQIEEMRAKEDKEQEEKLIQSNMMSQQQSNQQAAQNNAQLLEGEKNLELRNQVELEKIKGMLRMEENRQKSEAKAKETAIANLWGWGASYYSRKNE